MEPFRVLSGQAAPLLQANIDTDVIIRIERLTAADQTQLGNYALEALRYQADGRENPDFILNQPRFRNAPILLAGPNFGCGSSREGAVTALLGRGIRSVIAPSFGDIFYNNCFQNGLLPVRLDEAEIEAMAREIEASDQPVRVDLVDLEITTPLGRRLAFALDPQQRAGLLAGLDDIGQTLLARDDIVAWQDRDRLARPRVWRKTEANRA